MSNEKIPTTVEKLSRVRAQEQLGNLFKLIRLIPKNEYTEEDILRETKPDGRVLTQKWDHSYIASMDSETAGVLLAYERSPENNSFYPVRSLYISELAVFPEFQGNGIAKELLINFHRDALKEANINNRPFMIQTNAADWNDKVRSLYESFGYKVIGTKPYDNRVDLVMRAMPSDVIKALDENYQ